MNNKYKRILVANRGDSAVRVIRACKEMGIETVSIYSRVDKDSYYTRLSDYSVCIGDAPSIDSYLNAYNILSVAIEYKVDAIHPGIGFLSENPDFCELCESCDIDFIGPSSSTISLMGNKAKAKRMVKQLNIPIIGEEIIETTDYKNCLQHSKAIGYPILLKAVNGGGGKGIRIVYNEDDLSRALELCQIETKKVFGSESILVEPYIENAKHIEVQVLGDMYGNVIHLGDRECTIQRKNQKLIEETRCNKLDEELRNKMYQGAIDICKHIGYVGVGTIEYILEDNKEFYFLEMNTRLQVEHTISEMITGIDLVKEQIKVAQEERLNIEQNNVSFNGYAIECRILAEHFAESIKPSCGKITRFDMPGGFGVRVDASYELHNNITPYYDSLISKICCHGKDKEEAVNKMLRSLDEMRVEGVSTNKELLLSILKNQRFLTGDYTTTFYDDLLRGEK